MSLNHPQLVDLLKKAYSAEKAAAFAYIGHAKSVRDPAQKAEIRQIEQDEWDHRREVLSIMQTYGILPSRWYEFQFHVIGRLISLSCRVIGWFMPFYFAGRLESGNVCEYFRMLQYFEQLGITENHQMLYDMGMREKEHEMYFLEKLRSHRLLPLFETCFGWGSQHTRNDVDLDAKYSVPEAAAYCRRDVKP